MKLFSILFLIILPLNTILGQDCMADIHVISDIENTEYLLDSNKVGEGKDFTFKADTGSYVLTAREKGRFWNPLEYTDTVRITGCGEYKFEFAFSAVLYLKSEPPDAYVISNDSLIGNTPLYIPGRSDNIRLTKPGYRDVELSGSVLNDVIRLQEDSGKNGRPFYQRSLFRYLIGGLVVLGATTAYFKLEADKKFERYEITGSQALLDETRRYDLISGIAFGALQVNFGLLLYYFLSE